MMVWTLSTYVLDPERLLDTSTFVFHHHVPKPLLKETMKAECAVWRHFPSRLTK